MMDEIINKMDEDAPANAVAHGGVDMNPTGKKKKKDEVPAKLMDVIMKRMSGKIKEDNDNNNVVLKGVLDKLDKLDENKEKFKLKPTHSLKELQKLSELFPGKIEFINLKVY